ncbi:hypothetical protein JCM10450v2_004813 [Rhodotorula kratochvilovae]
MSPLTLNHRADGAPDAGKWAWVAHGEMVQGERDAHKEKELERSERKRKAGKGGQKGCDVGRGGGHKRDSVSSVGDPVDDVNHAFYHPDKTLVRFPWLNHGGSDHKPASKESRAPPSSWEEMVE